MSASMIHNQRPYAVKLAIPAGPVPTGLAKRVFGDDFLWGESYFSDGKFIRRIIFEDEARGLGLAFYFDAQPCRNGHIAPRKLFKHKRQTQCMACRNIHRKRAARRKLENEVH